MAVIDEPSLFDEEEEPLAAIPSAQIKPDLLWNLGTLIVLLCLVIVVAIFTLIYVNPNAMVNPYPPPTMPVAMLLPTITATPPAPTPAPTLEPTQTPTPAASPTPAVFAEPTATRVSAVTVVSPTPYADAEYRYALKGAPAFIDAALLYPGRGCQWMGVGGQVSDLSGRPVTGMNVQMVGTMDGASINVITLTGTALKYGEAGFEFTISDAGLFNSRRDFWVQLIDQQRNPLSEQVFFDTFDDCAVNLIVINFSQVR
ncbi:MAG: hypothetical protein ROW39_05930 [Anaerolineaceae bacterium]|jgi:hypothetical protein